MHWISVRLYEMGDIKETNKKNYLDGDGQVGQEAQDQAADTPPQDQPSQGKEDSLTKVVGPVRSQSPPPTRA